jgi:hypothetical protein
MNRTTPRPRSAITVAVIVADVAASAGRDAALAPHRAQLHPFRVVETIPSEKEER